MRRGHGGAHPSHRTAQRLTANTRPQPTTTNDLSSTYNPDETKYLADSSIPTTRATMATLKLDIPAPASITTDAFTSALKVVLGAIVFSADVQYAQGTCESYSLHPNAN